MACVATFFVAQIINRIFYVHIFCDQRELMGQRYILDTFNC